KLKMQTKLQQQISNDHEEIYLKYGVRVIIYMGFHALRKFKPTVTTLLQ
ncbi:11873_t:CDS:2, partial [Gigaspora rosea]